VDVLAHDDYWLSPPQVRYEGPEFDPTADEAESDLGKPLTSSFCIQMKAVTVTYSYIVDVLAHDDNWLSPPPVRYEGPEFDPSADEAESDLGKPLTVVLTCFQSKTVTV
jgi:hypothetical protein